MKATTLNLRNLNLKRRNKNLLNSAIANSSFLPLNNLKPLASTNNQSLKFFDYNEIKNYIGELSYNNISINGFLFECVRDTSNKLPTVAYIGDIEGKDYFAFDATNLDIPIDKSCTYVEARSLLGLLSDDHMQILNRSRSILDWNLRNKFDNQSGRPLFSCWAGYKKACTSALSTDVDVISYKDLNNNNYPRTDPVIITAVLSPSKDRILLGRNKKYPNGMFSCLAGFVDIGESLEDALSREVYEESGVQISNSSYHGSQPWPFPSSLMMGFYATVDVNTDYENLTTEIDDELEEVKWFNKDEVLKMALNSPNSLTEPRKNGNENYIPNEYPIAGDLIRGWLNSSSVALSKL